MAAEQSGGKAEGKAGSAQRSLPKCCVVQARMQGVGIWLRIPVPAIQNGANRMPRSGVYAQKASATWMLLRRKAGKRDEIEKASSSYRQSGR